MTLSIDDLFTPAPSGVGPNPPATGTWLEQLLLIAAQVGLDTTSWQPGDPSRSLIAIDAVALSQEDVLISILAQGGFLDFAASGSVTYTGVDGTTVTTPVTPDPSIPSQNPTGTPGFLDVLCDSVYNVQRIQAGAALGLEAVVNTSASTYNYGAGAYHISNSQTNATFTNLAALTITPSSSKVVSAIVPSTNFATVTTSTAHGLTTGQYVYFTGVNGISGANSAVFGVTVTNSTQFVIYGTFTGGYTTPDGTMYLCQTFQIQADIAGTSGTSIANSITTTVTKNTGVFISNPSGLSGQNWESNTALAARARLKLGALSPNGARGAYEYFALTASTYALGAVGYALQNTITNATAYGNTSNGTVVTYVAGESIFESAQGSPVVSGSVNSVTGAVGTPIVITTGAPHNATSPTSVYVTGVLGNTAANGVWTANPTSSTQLQLIGSTSSGAYTANTGAIEVGDLGAIDAVIQQNCVPDGIIATVSSALAFPVTVGGAVTVPFNKFVEYTANVGVLLQNYFDSLAIGGPSGGLRIDVIIGLLYQAGSVNNLPSYVNNISAVTLNSVAADLSYPSSAYIALLQPLGISIQGI